MLDPVLAARKLNLDQAELINLVNHFVVWQHTMESHGILDHFSREGLLQGYCLTRDAKRGPVPTDFPLVRASDLVQACLKHYSRAHGDITSMVTFVTTDGQPTGPAQSVPVGPNAGRNLLSHPPLALPGSSGLQGTSQKSRPRKGLAVKRSAPSTSSKPTNLSKKAMPHPNPEDGYISD